MQVRLANDLQLEYESFGSPDAPAILLIMGLGAQLLRWNIEICDGLVDAGYRVIRFDNRDCGLSTHFDDAPIPAVGDIITALRNGEKPAVPYTLDDMAADCVGLLDALGIDAAHIVGISMGGAIAQLIAAHHAARVLSLTCLMASSGNLALPGPTPEAATALFAPLPRERSRDSIVADGIRRFRVVASPAYPSDDAWLQQLFAREFERGFYPPGVARQLAAIIANGDRCPLLATIRVPTLVLHGAADPLIPVACGEDIARHVPDARLHIIPGMGHDLPLALTGELVGAIAALARAADGATADA